MNQPSIGAPQRAGLPHSVALWATALGMCTSASLWAQDTGSPFDTLETTVVTGSQVAEPLRDTPVRTEVIDAALLQQTGTRTLAEAVEFSPGVRIDTACSNCNQQSIQMLGLPQQYIGLLFDGMPSFSTLAGVYGIEQIPAGTIGQIEIVKGGGSVLYGPGAVAGVINLVPREPEESGGRIEARLQGSQGDSFGQAPGGNLFGLYDYVSDDEKVKATFYGGFDRVQPLDLNGDGFTDVSMRNLATAGFRTLWRPAEDHTLSIDFSYSDEERRGGDTGDAFERAPNESQIAEEIMSQRLTNTIKWQADWNAQWSTRFAYAYSHTKRDSYYGGTVALGTDSALGFGNTKDDLHFLDALASYQLSDQHRFTFGSNFKSENIVDNQGSVNRNLDQTFENLGIYAQHRWKPQELWTLEYGLRGDFNSEINDPIFSPRAAILWSPEDDLRIRGAVSTGFRAPEVFDEDLHIESVGGDLRTTFNDPNLKEESSVTISLSPEWQVNEHLRLEMNAFHTWLDDTFVVQPNDDPSTPGVIEEIRTNGEGSKVYGAEFNLGYFTDFWSLELSWVQQRLEYDSPQLVLGDPDDTIDNAIFSNTYVRTPESLGLLRFNHDGKWVDSFITGKLTGPMDIPRVVSNPGTGDLEGNRLERSPWFFNVDIGVSRDFLVGDGELTTTLGIKNLFDDYQSDLESGAFRDASYIYGPAFPRTFFGSLNYSF
ncbi:TonB-dependent receptor plug domain-containing protein [Rubritalea marina]|uniref:TonB-dependent receptor plug domain-containing protein n=1 Tax=Rubritalea marina TaxID=361055 RepID=UPI0009FBE68F|nr:TonB-dependent receptor [Rubritalea marina]